MEIGAILCGKISGIIDYGAFVDCENGQRGMVHISEVANSYVENIREHLTMGQEVRVKVLNITPEGKISLSIKKALEPAQPAAASARPRPPRKPAGSPNVWQGGKPKREAPQNFEDMMSRFKQTSEENISTLRKSGDSRYNGGAKRRK
ncbi:MAG: S1 RNA-binding domain-containing protein [Oscillospiraceae bacterium]|nr:S1 RNA-binding domain-containing protein [Oscillospiraceae bacterium]